MRQMVPASRPLVYICRVGVTDYRACHAGIGRGDGWIIPLNIYIETQQFIPAQCTIFENLGMVYILVDIFISY